MAPEKTQFVEDIEDRIKQEAVEKAKLAIKTLLDSERTTHIKPCQDCQRVDIDADRRLKEPFTEYQDLLNFLSIDFLQDGAGLESLGSRVERERRIVREKLRKYLGPKSEGSYVLRSFNKIEAEAGGNMELREVIDRVKRSGVLSSKQIAQRTDITPIAYRRKESWSNEIGGNASKSVACKALFLSRHLSVLDQVHEIVRTNLQESHAACVDLARFTRRSGGESFMDFYNSSYDEMERVHDALEDDDEVARFLLSYFDNLAGDYIGKSAWILSTADHANKNVTECFSGVNEGLNDAREMVQGWDFDAAIEFLEKKVGLLKKSLKSFIKGDAALFAMPCSHGLLEESMNEDVIELIQSHGFKGGLEWLFEWWATFKIGFRTFKQYTNPFNRDIQKVGDISEEAMDKVIGEIIRELTFLAESIKLLEFYIGLLQKRKPMREEYLERQAEERERLRVERDPSRVLKGRDILVCGFPEIHIESFVDYLGKQPNHPNSITVVSGQEELDDAIGLGAEEPVDQSRQVLVHAGSAIVDESYTGTPIEVSGDLSVAGIFQHVFEVLR